MRLPSGREPTFQAFLGSVTINGKKVIIDGSNRVFGLGPSGVDIRGTIGSCTAIDSARALRAAGVTGDHSTLIAGNSIDIDGSVGPYSILRAGASLTVGNGVRAKQCR